MDPDSLPLLGWLDAGEVMLRQDADTLWRRLLDDAFSADSVEAVNRAFAALQAEAEYRRKLHDEHDAKQRADSDAPSHFRSLSQEQLDAAVAEVASWAGVPRDGSEPDDDKVRE